MPILTRNLLKILLRDVKKNKLLFLALITLNILGVTSYVSFVLGYQSLELSYQKFYDDYSFHDFEIRALEGTWINQSLLKTVSKDFKANYSEIKNISSRIIIDSGYNFTNKKDSLYGAGKVVGFDTTLPIDQRIDNLFIREGSTFWVNESYTNKVIINTQFADQLNLTVGDKLSIVLGNLTEFEVIGVAYSVEHVVVIPSRYGSVFPRTGYGIFFMPISEVQEVLKLNGKVNDIILTFNEGTPSITKIKLVNEFSKLIESELEVKLQEPIPKELQISNWFLRLNVEGFKEISETLPLLILAVTALAIFITQNRLIKGQKRQIGIALSLGYYPNAIFIHYLSFVVFIGTIGGSFGILLGIIISRVIAEVYVSAISLPFVTIALNPSVLFVGFFLGFITGLIGGFLPAWNGCRMTPKEAMETYRMTPSFTKDLFWKLISRFSLKAYLKLPLRNILRNRWRSSTNLVGIAAAVAILLISLGLLDSGMTALDTEFSSISNYDLEVTFRTPKLGDLGLYDDLGIIKNISNEYGIESVECALIIPIVFHTTDGKKTNEGTLTAFNSTTPSTHKFRFDRRFSSEWEESNSSIVLTSGLVNYFDFSFQSGIRVSITHPRLPISPLEELWLQLFFQQNGRNATIDFLRNQFHQELELFSYNQTMRYSLMNSTLSIGGISKETWGTISYISMRKMKELIGFGIFDKIGVDLTPVSTIFIKLNSEGKKIQSDLREEILSQLDDVQSVLLIEEIKEGIMEFLDLFFTLVGVMIVLSSLISVSTVFTVVFLNIHERKRELVTVQVLGMTDQELTLSITIENLIIGIIALIIGFPTGILLTQLIISNLFPVMLYFEVSIHLLTLLTVLLITLTSILLAEYPALKHLFKLELTDITKEIIN
ncbi:MAG: FtsX-like permease family protein [Candidatus Hermodarchaeota archaeon]